MQFAQAQAIYGTCATIFTLLQMLPNLRKYCAICADIAQFGETRAYWCNLCNDSLRNLGKLRVFTQCCTTYTYVSVNNVAQVVQISQVSQIERICTIFAEVAQYTSCVIV